jgi:hypothetical protein
MVDDMHEAATSDDLEHAGREGEIAETKMCMMLMDGIAWLFIEGDREMKAVFSRVFTLEVDGRATLAFEASATRQAMELCKESWLLDDLTFLRSNGVPLGTVGSRLSVRPATPKEITVFKQAAESAEASDDMVLAYLVELDGWEAQGR